MSVPNNILDHTEPDANNPENHLASTGTRLANFILDRIGFFLALIIMFKVLPALNRIAVGVSGSTSSAFIVLPFLLLIPGYYILFEYLFGKTPAKFLTKTKVVTKHGKKPGFWNIVGRTLCRFVPFEPFSFLGSRAVGWHDSISATYVVKDSYKYHSGAMIEYRDNDFV